MEDFASIYGIEFLTISEAPSELLKVWSRFAVSRAVGIYRIVEGNTWKLVMDGTSTESLKGEIEADLEMMRFERIKMQNYQEPIVLQPEQIHSRGGTSHGSTYAKDFD